MSRRLPHPADQDVSSYLQLLEDLPVPARQTRNSRRINQRQPNEGSPSSIPPPHHQPPPGQPPPPKHGGGGQQQLWNHNISSGTAHTTQDDSFWASNREAVAIVGGVIGFWGGVFLLGIVYLIFVCVRRIRKGLFWSGNTGSGGAISHRPPIREDQQPRERKRRAHHYQNFYGSGSRSAFGRSDGDSSGISLTRLGFGGGDRGRADGGFSTAMYPSSGGGARIKFGGVSFRNRDMHEPVASSQL